MLHIFCKPLCRNGLFPLPIQRFILSRDEIRLQVNSHKYNNRLFTHLIRVTKTIGMLKYAGIGVALGNAGEDVKAAADYVTADIDDDGVWKALEHFQPFLYTEEK